MPIKVNYNGKEIVSPDDSTRATVNCKGNLMEDNIVVDASEAHTKDSDTLVGLIEGTLTEIYDDRATQLSGRVLSGNPTITSVVLLNVTTITINGGAFSGCTNLEYVYMPKLLIISYGMFQNASKLTYFDGVSIQSINQYAFNGASSFTHLFIRPKYVRTLSSVNAFSGTPFEYGVGTGSYVYVPRALLESYQSATNWSGLDCTWNAIEDYTVDGTITGDIDWKLIDGATIFTIDGNKYYNFAYTWKMWFEYEEPNGFEIVVENSVSYIKTSDGKYVYDSSGNKQTSDDWIIDGAEYYTA